MHVGLMRMTRGLFIMPLWYNDIKAELNWIEWKDRLGFCKWLCAFTHSPFTIWIMKANEQTQVWISLLISKMITLQESVPTLWTKALVNRHTDEATGFRQAGSDVGAWNAVINVKPDTWWMGGQERAQPSPTLAKINRIIAGTARTSAKQHHVLYTHFIPDQPITA